MGLKVKLVSAGKYKVERADTGPLSDEAEAALQADVDRYYSMFVADVAKGRGVPVETVRSEFGEGRAVGAKEAVGRGMASAVGTFGDAYRRAERFGAEVRRNTAALLEAQAARASLDLAQGTGPYSSTIKAPVMSDCGGGAGGDDPAAHAVAGVAAGVNRQQVPSAPWKLEPPNCVTAS
jgi:ClpP class serine protease